MDSELNYSNLEELWNFFRFNLNMGRSPELRIGRVPERRHQLHLTFTTSSLST
jgi:hypothetical protein